MFLSSSYFIRLICCSMILMDFCWSLSSCWIAFCSFFCCLASALASLMVIAVPPLISGFAGSKVPDRGPGTDQLVLVWLVSRGILRDRSRLDCRQHGTRPCWSAPTGPSCCSASSTVILPVVWNLAILIDIIGCHWCFRFHCPNEKWCWIFSHMLIFHLHIFFDEIVF